jgi:hypothetical protein
MFPYSTLISFNTNCSIVGSILILRVLNDNRHCTLPCNKTQNMKIQKTGPNLWIKVDGTCTICLSLTVTKRNHRVTKC